ncbi:MAG TPA: bifunctional UDP-N-acetylglucosamine diphosphorylase/glucosamine-1-phosphate N-acetyltransferase GlmU [Chloroflexota bacterium]|nr:bifunctional UDP-N-acetylglucosamine diphosphorylase/glucosamine-1-phosphate N-acetyltransferase GlmU [Chloroflexota bacterium]
MGQTAAVILAAGHGKRMRSALPKPLHPVAGRPMIGHVLDAVRGAGISRVVAVLGHGAEQVRPVLGPDVQTVEQSEVLGTGDALRRAATVLGGDSSVSDVLVCGADMPLVTGEIFADLIAQRQATGATLAMVVSEAADPTGYGRAIRDADGRVRAVVEQADASESQRAVRQVNAGIYAFWADWLWRSLPEIRQSPSGEYYLTDLIAMANGAGHLIQSIEAPLAWTAGVNNRIQLAEAEQLVRDRIRRNLMLSGVTLVDPPSTFVDAGVTIGTDTVLLPGTIITGQTVIGGDCRIGPYAQIVDSRVGDGVSIGSSLIEASELADNVRIGPYCHLRAGTRLDEGAELGDHAEVKNAHLGAGTRMHHFSYVGDAEIGKGVNIGAGTITCNYDAESGVKSRTVVGDRASLGSDTLLVAPVTIGDGALTGSGAVVTRDVEPETLVVGVPARPLRKRRTRPSN